MDTNPYASSQSYGYQQSTSGLEVSPAALKSLAGTSPWVKFCSIIGFLLAGLLIMVGVVVIIAGIAGAAFTSPSDPFGDGPAMAGGVLIGVSIFYFLMGVLYLFPSIKLWKFGSSISRLMMSNQTSDLENALEAQRSFWKFVGIMIIIFIALYVLLFIGAMFFSVALGSRFPSPP